MKASLRMSKYGYNSLTSRNIKLCDISFIAYLEDFLVFQVILTKIIDCFYHI